MNLEVYNSIFNITEENTKFELFIDNFQVFSFEELKDELEEILNNSNNTPYHLQHEKTGIRIIEAYKKLRSEKSNTDGYISLVMGYARFPFTNFENFVRVVVGLDREDIQTVLRQNISLFVT